MTLTTSSQNASALAGYNPKASVIQVSINARDLSKGNV